MAPIAPAGRLRARVRTGALAVTLALIAGACSGPAEEAIPATGARPTPTPPGLALRVTPTPAPTPPPTPTTTPRPAPTAEPTPFAAGDAEALPVDPDVVIGTLDNGLTYYVRHNAAPGGRVELRLAVDAGSVHEDDDQSGVAHFLEHMLFNGTERWPANELIRVLESFGSQFGPDVNASTSFEETVYELSLPTDDPALVTAGVDVLREWASRATIDPGEVEAERGVVFEEWRLRDQGAGGRLNDLYADLLTPGSGYEGRLPIGDPDAIRTMTRDRLQRFYRDWYRPDLMAVVAVGDIDVDDIEALIVDRFADLAPAGSPRPSPAVAVADAEAVRYRRLADPDLPSAYVEVIWPGPTEPPDSVGAHRRMLARRLAEEIIDTRFADDVSRGRAPYLTAYTSGTPLARGIDAPGLLAEAPPRAIQASFERLLEEVERVRRHGFEPAELDRARTVLLRSLAQRDAGRATTQDGDYAARYVDHFVAGVPIPGWDDLVDLETRLLEDMTAEYVAGVLLDVVDGRAPQVLVVGPEADGDALPGEPAVRRLLAEVPERPVPPRVEDGPGRDQLMAVPEPAPIVERGQVAALGARTLELANGVRVLLKRTGIAEGFFGIEVRNPGGLSLLAVEDLAAAFVLPDVLTRSGVGELDQVELDRFLADEVVVSGLALRETFERVTASGSAERPEVVFQLLNRYLTAPRVQPSALDAVVAELAPLAADPSAVPSLAAADELIDARYRSSPRYRMFPTVDDLAAVDPADVERIHRQAFGDAAGTVVAIVGDLELSRMEDLAARYLGTLPSDGEPDGWVDRQPAPPPGVVEREVRVGQDDQGSVTMLFIAERGSDQLTDIELVVLRHVLSARLRDRLREALGATYSPSTSIASAEEPDALIETIVEVTGDPDRLPEIVEETLAVMADLRSGGITEDEAARAREQVRRDVELLSNGFWIDQLLYAATHPGVTVPTVDQRIRAASSVTVAELTALAQEVLVDERYIVVNLVPAT